MLDENKLLMKFVIAKESKYLALYFLRKYNNKTFKKFSITCFERWPVSYK